MGVNWHIQIRPKSWPTALGRPSSSAATSKSSFWNFSRISPLTVIFKHHHNDNKLSNLFQLENMLIEEVLKLFVSKVDTELLKAISIVEVLKTKYIKETNREIVLGLSVVCHQSYKKVKPSAYLTVLRWKTCRHRYICKAHIQNCFKDGANKSTLFKINIIIKGTNIMFKLKLKFNYHELKYNI